ncbi:hypothetical protein VTN96DRAFT_1132 [Rasamsonia emersonii]
MPGEKYSVAMLSSHEAGASDRKARADSPVAPSRWRARLDHGRQRGQTSDRQTQHLDFSYNSGKDIIRQIPASSIAPLEATLVELPRYWPVLSLPDIDSHDRYAKNMRVRNRAKIFNASIHPEHRR